MNIDEVIKKTVDEWQVQEEPIESPQQEEPVQQSEPEQGESEGHESPQDEPQDEPAGQQDNDPLTSEEPSQDSNDSLEYVEPSNNESQLDLPLEEDPPDPEEPEPVEYGKSDDATEAPDPVSVPQDQGDLPEENPYPDFEESVAPAGVDTEPEQPDSPEAEMPEIEDPEPEVGQEQENSIKQEVESTPKDLSNQRFNVDRADSEPQGLNLNVTMGLEDGVAEQIANQVAPHLDRLQLTIQHHIEDAISLRETEIGLMGMGND